MSRIWMRNALEATQTLPTQRYPYPLDRRGSSAPGSPMIESVLGCVRGACITSPVVMGAITHQNLLDISQSVVTHSIARERDMAHYERGETLRFHYGDQE